MLALSTKWGDYNASVRFLYAVFAFLAPDAPAPAIEGMYGVTAIFRRGASVLLSGVLCLLLIRAVQRGEPNLKRRTVVAVCGGGFLLLLLDNAVRAVSANRHGGWSDLLQGCASLGAFMGLVALFFATKKWERNRFHEPTNVTPSAIE